MKLAEVIREARREYDRLSRAVQSGTEPPIALLDNGKGGEDRFVAAAVAAHLESDEAIERAARALAWPDIWEQQDDTARAGHAAYARAAIRAAIGGEHE